MIALRRAEQRHRPRRSHRCAEPLMRPGLPLVRIDLQDIQLLHRHERDVVSLPDGFDDRAGLCHPTMPLLMLLTDTATNRRHKALARLTTEGIHHRRHPTRVDQRYIREAAICAALLQPASV